MGSMNPKMNVPDPLADSHLLENRRQFFGRASTGIGTAALAALMAGDVLSGQASAAEMPVLEPRFGGLPGVPHFAPKAKRVIYLMQSGAPSHVDLFDYKPKLAEMRGQDLPPSVQMGQRLTTMTQGAKQRLLPGIAPFHQHGESGAWLCSFLPHMASIADELCFIKTMHTESINHAPATTMFLTGDRYEDHVEFQAAEGDFTDVALMTDGVERLALSFEGRTPHTPFFDPLFNALRSAPAPAALNTELCRFLESDSMKRRSDDDKTVILAVQTAAR